MQTFPSREEYVQACNLLRLHPGRLLEWNKAQARTMLETMVPSCQLRFEAAAMTILRTTRQSLVP